MDTRRGWSAIALAVTLAGCAGTAEHTTRPTLPVPAAPAVETPKPTALQPTAPDAAGPRTGVVRAPLTPSAPGDAGASPRATDPVADPATPALREVPRAVVTAAPTERAADPVPVTAGGEPVVEPVPAIRVEPQAQPNAAVPQRDSVAGLSGVYEQMRDDIRNGDLPRAAERFTAVEHLLTVAADDPRHEIAGDLRLLGGYVRARLEQRRARD